MSAANPVAGMFGRIAGVYDFLNRLLSLGIDRAWRARLAELTVPGKTGVMPDLAAGTLDVALAVLARHPEVVVPAVDFCAPMLARGLKKLDDEQKRRRILPLAGDALNLPLADDGADSLTMAFGIRNITPRAAAFNEMLRVLAPGGRACVLEFGSGKDKIWGGVYNFYLERVLPGIGKLFARDDAYRYLARTIREFPSAAGLAEEMREAGFVDVEYKKLTSGIVCLHWGQKPVS